jgi:hypothetical protein
MAYVVWNSGTQIRTATIGGSGAQTIGRQAGVNVVVEDETVSRRHGAISQRGADYWYQHLSQTNASKVNGNVVVADTRLADGDSIQLGLVILTFHDLASVTRGFSLTCSHCRRANAPDRRDCWFCGTSLVNAPTSIPQRGEAVCRLVPAHGGKPLTLFPGESACLSRDGALALAASAAKDCAAIVHATDVGANIEPGGVPVNLNGSSVEGARPLAAGDIVDVAGATLVLLFK